MWGLWGRSSKMDLSARGDKDTRATHQDAGLPPVVELFEARHQRDKGCHLGSRGNGAVLVDCLVSAIERDAAAQLQNVGG
jgi:hypothetical protein